MEGENKERGKKKNERGKDGKKMKGKKERITRRRERIGAKVGKQIYNNNIYKDKRNTRRRRRRRIQGVSGGGNS